MQAHTNSLKALLSTEPRSKPALCLGCLVLDNGIKLVGGGIDLLAGSGILLLSVALGLLKLGLRFRAVGIKLLLRLLCLRLGLVGLN